MAPGNPNLDRTGKSSPRREKQWLADLPRGITLCWDDNGHGTKGVRVRFEKKFTGGKAFKASYPSKKAAAEGIATGIGNRTLVAMELTPKAVADARSPWKFFRTRRHWWLPPALKSAKAAFFHGYYRNYCYLTRYCFCGTYRARHPGGMAPDVKSRSDLCFMAPDFQGSSGSRPSSR